MTLTREQLLRQFELASDRFSGLQSVLLAWPHGSPEMRALHGCPPYDVPPQYRHLPAYSFTTHNTRPTLIIDGVGQAVVAAWPCDASGRNAAAIDGYKTEAHLVMNHQARLWEPDHDDPELLNFEYEARKRYRQLAEVAVSLVSNPDGLSWSALLHERIQPTRHAVHAGWYSVIPDVFLASLALLNGDNPAGDGPTAMGRFQWQGREYNGLDAVPWRLLKYVWDAPHQTASFDGMAEAVWLDCESNFSGGPLKSAANKVREFLREHKIPLTITSSERNLTVAILQVAKKQP